jgi:hypothetical protein
LQIASLEWQRFRETGVLVFAMFDQEFPGHYLRLIKRVRVSVIVLVPPVRGVRATLSASGLSRVIVAGDEFSPVRLSRSPEAIAFTSPLNVTGLFELEPESGLLLPFEGMGVDTVWQLELPKAANPFDYRTIADVLLTIEYTALNSYDYRHQVLRAQDRSFSGDRAFSVRDQFPDACYEFNNPESVADEASRMRATLPIRREDSPPHLEELAVQELSLFCSGRMVSLQNCTSTLPDIPRQAERPSPPQRCGTTSGIVGIRRPNRPNGAAWEVLLGHNPVGEWSIQLDNSELARAWFKNGSIQDLVLVVRIIGVTPAWLWATLW